MKIEGFTYVRNGLRMGYPFVASIKSALPIVDKIYVVVGNSDDGTREAVVDIGSDKIVIIDTVWDDSIRTDGAIFRQQANIGLEQTKGDWCLHIQADEVLDEFAKDEIIKTFELADKHDDVDGVIFPRLNFWGDYNHVQNTRRADRYEVRAFKSNRNVMSFGDSHSFRKYETKDYSTKGEKLIVIKSKATFYHYSYTRNPKLMTKKSNYFNTFWHNDEWIKAHSKTEEFDYNIVDKLEPFKGKHPIYMEEVIKNQDWEFNYNPKLSNMTLKEKVLYNFEKLFNYRPFEYKNFIEKKV
ncbi:MAG: hypothetical protein ACOXZ9_05130 [Bacteroidales bacterium]|jgi:hypothetical protein